MASKSYVRAQGSGCSITVDASPGAKKTEIGGVNLWRGALQIRIAAEPRDGAANEELVRFLASKLGIEKDEVRILKGERSPLKVVFLPLAPEKIRAVLGGD